MPLADVVRQFDYWNERTPVGDLVSVIAQVLGWKPPEREVEQISYQEAANENAEWFARPERWFPKGA